MVVKEILSGGAHLLSHLSGHADTSESTKAPRGGRTESEEENKGTASKAAPVSAKSTSAAAAGHSRSSRATSDSVAYSDGNWPQSLDGSSNVQSESKQANQGTGQVNGKRQRDDNDDPSPEDLSRMSRSERKRHREKKRRSDVNKGFDDLMALLMEIDPAVKAEAEEKARRTNGRPANVKVNDLDSSALINRVDLISRAVTALERVHKENEERKLLIADLSSRLSGDTPASASAASALARNKVANEKVTMMIPMLTPSDSAISAAARNAEVMAQQHMLQNSLAQAQARFQQAIPVSFPQFPPGSFLGFGSQALRGSTQSSMSPAIAASLLRPNSGADSVKRQQDLMRQIQQSGAM
mmetsp:Transcript_16677/g.23504  ORF Transcript_16677/g.23504 Transcript_16677/m.23504 type:complete len:355 (-) Transcript_16677:337-1401(-)